MVRRTMKETAGTCVSDWDGDWGADALRWGGWGTHVLCVGGGSGDVMKRSLPEKTRGTEVMCKGPEAAWACRPAGGPPASVDDEGEAGARSPRAMGRSRILFCVTADGF